MEKPNENPAPEDIAALSRIYWEEGGQLAGKDEENWLRAEKHLRAQQAGTERTADPRANE